MRFEFDTYNIRDAFSEDDYLPKFLIYFDFWTHIPGFVRYVKLKRKERVSLETTSNIVEKPIPELKTHYHLTCIKFGIGTYGLEIRIEHSPFHFHTRTVKKWNEILKSEVDSEEHTRVYLRGSFLRIQRHNKV